MYSYIKYMIILYEEKRRHEEVQRVNQSETAQGQNETESINSSVNSSSNASSEGISCNIWTRFKRITDRIMSEKKLTLDEVCNRIAIEISDYGIGKICAQTVKNFYHKNNSHSIRNTFPKTFAEEVLET
ncbi:unnamed protein product [Rhizophagus irregularis]|uniref:Uncharacterized protein n=4 Tax=Rhizophagus irregularis TaxID=588596 RepID=A0A2P4P7I2_RHIID|nr:hypothetical protein GLOIN_2v1486303 [Rhizophagus irregularis DAOM 181602=DAOM 197198]POG61346.1 hypothetical protein GLOIN_2v1486303 [Rhizophagus irregularis DAOM 181602=DAOM 197198]CAB4424250.1 unnamed protein product [Rhizophagus irregularis]|eukprot:XP_025168212.1 hypothetical protein GLOIN_2v1486303 [Rhizophagus irregularis DAOM 181602=DAOM 197198]